MKVKDLEWERLDNRCLKAEPDEICEILVYTIIPSASGDGYCNLNGLRLGDRGLGAYLGSFKSTKEAKQAAQDSLIKSCIVQGEE